MEIKNNSSKILLHDNLQIRRYRVSFICDGEFNFNFLLRSGNKTIILGPRITHKDTVRSFTFEPSSSHSQLILANITTASWTTANIDIEEI